MKKPSLSKQLEEALADAKYYRGRYEQAQHELDSYKDKERKLFDSRISRFEMQGQQMFEANQQLMEIIRWHINPETTKKELPMRDQFGNIINRN